MTKKKTINIKEYLDDDSLDLSLCSLQEVPVKEIASVPKATNVDLSSNVLTVLGNNFATSLSHLVKLDLSSNQLYELPENFGLLVNLKHLDLYKNKLQTLPLSCAGLRSLRWLDLKENPLVPKMAQVVGTCLDQAECLAAARKVVKHLAVVQKELEEEKQRKEQERIQKMMEDERKALKKGEKQKRRKNRKNAAKAAENAKNEIDQNGGAAVPGHLFVEDVPKFVSTKRSQPRTSFFGIIGAALASIFRVIVLTSLTVALGLFIVSMLDESVYAKCITFLKSAASATYHKVPPMLKNRLLSVYNLSVVFTRHAVTNAMFLVAHSGKTVVQWYNFFTTDEMFLAYSRTFDTYLHIVHIKTLELWSICSQKIDALVKGVDN